MVTYIWFTSSVISSVHGPADECIRTIFCHIMGWPRLFDVSTGSTSTAEHRASVDNLWFAIVIFCFEVGSIRIAPSFIFNEHLCVIFTVSIIISRHEFQISLNWVFCCKISNYLGFLYRIFLINSAKAQQIKEKKVGLCDKNGYCCSEICFKIWIDIFIGGKKWIFSLKWSLKMASINISSFFWLKWTSMRNVKLLFINIGKFFKMIHIEIFLWFLEWTRFAWLENFVRNFNCNISNEIWNSCRCDGAAMPQCKTTEQQKEFQSTRFVTNNNKTA